MKDSLKLKTEIGAGALHAKSVHAIPLWGAMHKWVTHNRHYATFSRFTDAILTFLRKTLPDQWHEFRDTVTDNFRIVSLDQYKVI